METVSHPERGWLQFNALDHARRISGTPLRIDQGNMGKILNRRFTFPYFDLRSFHFLTGHRSNFSGYAHDASAVRSVGRNADIKDPIFQWHDLSDFCPW